MRVGLGRRAARPRRLRTAERVDGRRAGDRLAHPGWWWPSSLAAPRTAHVQVGDSGTDYQRPAAAGEVVMEDATGATAAQIAASSASELSRS